MFVAALVAVDAEEIHLVSIGAGRGATNAVRTENDHALSPGPGFALDFDEPTTFFVREVVAALSEREHDAFPQADEGGQNSGFGSFADL